MYTAPHGRPRKGRTESHPAIRRAPSREARSRTARPAPLARNQSTPAPRRQRARMPRCTRLGPRIRGSKTTAAVVFRAFQSTHARRERADRQACVRPPASRRRDSHGRSARAALSPPNVFRSPWVKRMPIGGHMDFLIELRYAKERSHQMTLTSAEDLGPGSEFSLYGRSWRIVEPTAQRRSRPPVNTPHRLVCVPNE